MNFSSLEPSKKLYELSGWETGRVIRSEITLKKPGDTSTASVKSIVPAYDCGYLLRKLPNVELYDVIDMWEARVEGFNRVADTPEDALTMLAIKLFEEGVLTQEGSNEV